MGEMRNSYNVLVGKPEGKRPTRKSKHRWEVNTTGKQDGKVWAGCIYV
jgi:hypothetical protein